MWSTDYRGPILIHASKQIDVPGNNLFPAETNICRLQNDLGCVIGSAFLYNCTQKQRSDWHEEGLFGWYLADAVRLATHIPITGQLRLFEVKIEQMANVALCHRCKANLPGSISGLCGCCAWWLQTQSEKLKPEIAREHHAYREYLINRSIANAEGKTV